TLNDHYLHVHRCPRPREPHAFPTRRSSDLTRAGAHAPARLIPEGIMTRKLFLAGALLSAAAPLAAQQPEQRIDRVGHIVAVVGDSAILNFDIQESIIARAAQV